MAQTHEADPSLIPRLTVLVQDQGKSFQVRDDSARELVKIAQKHPDYRQQCIAILTATLERYPRNPIELNTSLIANLIDLKEIKRCIDYGAGKRDPGHHFIDVYSVSIERVTHAQQSKS